MQALRVLLALITVALLLPVLLPLVIVLDVLRRRRKAHDAERFACERCGQVLGRAGLERGDAAWAEHFTALEQDHPYSKLRVVRDVHAVCLRCGARYHYDKQARTFRPLPEPTL